MDRNCGDHGDTYAPRPDCRQSTDGEAKQQRLKDAGPAGKQISAVLEVEGTSKRRHLKFQNKKAAEASLTQRRRRGFLHSSRVMLVREWDKLGSAIRRAAAVSVCLKPSTGADEDDLPYMQLDKVTHAVSREAFGPIYLVT